MQFISAHLTPLLTPPYKGGYYGVRGKQGTYLNQQHYPLTTSTSTANILNLNLTYVHLPQQNTAQPFRVGLRG